jgi:hypothetical protein
MVVGEAPRLSKTIAAPFSGIGFAQISGVSGAGVSSWRHLCDSGSVAAVAVDGAAPAACTWNTVSRSPAKAIPQYSQ